MTEYCLLEPYSMPKGAGNGIEVLKDGEMFFTSLPSGNIPHDDQAGLGLYYRDTRFLSGLELLLNDTFPVFLSSMNREGHFSQIELTNKELDQESACPVPAQEIHLRFIRALFNGLLQRLRLANFHPLTVNVDLTINISADFTDIFEMRGFTRPERGKILPPRVGKSGLVFAYLGLDGSYRSTVVSFFPAPHEVVVHTNGRASIIYHLSLLPQKRTYLYMRVVPLIGDHVGDLPEAGPQRLVGIFMKNLPRKFDYCKLWRESCASFQSDNLLLNQMLSRGIADIYSLSSDYPGLGTIVEAGVPWYAAPFGRDSLIVAWQTLLVNPDIARQTLRFLARLQGQQVRPSRDEEPGKILHELRRGEMAACGEIPHTPYYGSVDSTLWFIIVLAETYEWTGDETLLAEMSGPMEKALQWCFNYGDVDGDGFIEYGRKAEKGLLNQGWKDSWNGVVDHYGKLPEGPIALVEVQGYYYLALVRAAVLYERLGRPEQAEDLRRRAAELKEKFLTAFWSEELDYPAFALDGAKRRLDVVVSNPGHLLFTGILPGQYADKVASRLFEPDMFSGWGIRTMSKKEAAAYNPMSYHNGSVWPHDNAIIAAGLRSCGKDQMTMQVLVNLFQAALTFPYYRLPELFCGFKRRGGESGPVHYPVACDPQAWAVASMFQLFPAVLGLRCRGAELYVCRPMLPQFVEEMIIKDIAAGSGRVDLEFSRKGDKTYCNVLKTTGPVRVIFISD